MMMGCNSRRSICVETQEDYPERRRSVKPEWHQEEARFIRNLCVEKERKKLIASIAPYPLAPASPFCCDHMANKKDVEDYKGFCGTPEVYIYRQKYLRSYKFTMEEENNVNKSNAVTEKAKKKRKGLHSKGKKLVKEKGNNMIIYCCRHCYFKFLVCFTAQVDVEEGAQRSAAASFKSAPRR